MEQCGELYLPNQVLIWTLYASDIRTHPLFQKVMKKLFGLKSSKNTFEQGYSGGLLPFWSSEVPFSKISVLFISVNITIIFYSFLLVWMTFLPWQIIMQTLKLFTVNGYYIISHWKIKYVLQYIYSEHFHKIHRQASVAVLKTVNPAAILNMCSATCDFQNIGLDTLTNTCG